MPQDVLALLKNNLPTQQDQYRTKPLVRTKSGRLAHFIETAVDEDENVAVLRFCDDGTLGYESEREIQVQNYSENILVKVKDGRTARSLYMAEDGGEKVVGLEFADGHQEVRRMESIEIVSEIPSDNFGLVNVDEEDLLQPPLDDTSMDNDEADGFLDESEDISVIYSKALVHQDAYVAKQMFEHILRIDPDNSDSAYQLGLLYENDFGNPTAAQKLYERAIEIEEDHVDALFTLGLLYENVHEKPRKARKYYEKAVKCNPLSANVYNNLGLLLMNQFEDYDEARKMYEEAIRVEPADVFAYNNLALLLTSHYQDFSRAKEMYIRAIEVDPEYIRAHNNLALLHVNLGDIEDAFHIYQKLLQMFPNDNIHQSHQYYNLAVLYSKTEQIEDAVEMYEKAISLNPNDILSLNNLGLLLETYFENFSRAKKLYEEAIRIDPASPHSFCAHHNLALLLITQFDDVKQAEKIYRYLIEQDPEDVKSFYNLALLASDRGDFKTSERFYLTCIQLDPTNSKPYTNLGLIYKEQMNRPSEAQQLFEKALQQYPDDEIALRELGKAARR